MYPTQDQITAPGQLAPNFELKAASTESVRLSDLRGQPVVLVFYPADFSPVCSDQLALYQTAAPAFAQYGAQLLGVSTDGVYCHQAFAQDRGLQFPLLADWWPHGQTAKAYGAFDDESGMAARALFVLDSQGVVNWSYLSPSGINPGADGILAALDAMANSPAAANSGPMTNKGNGPTNKGNGSRTAKTTTTKERVRTS